MKKPVRSKKGLTLVELIVASAISVIIMAAACTMFYVGSKSAQNGANAYINHGNAYTFETQLRNNLFEACDANFYTDGSSVPEPDDSNNIVKIYFDGNKMLWVKTYSKSSGSASLKSSMAYDGIKKFTFLTSNTEKPATNNDNVNNVSSMSNSIVRKPTVSYTITAETNKTTFELSGGITMNNVTDSSAFALHDTTAIENTDTDKYFVITVPRK